MSLTALREHVARVNDVLCATSLLVWDSRTMMPGGGAAHWMVQSGRSQPMKPTRGKGGRWSKSVPPWTCTGA